MKTTLNAERQRLEAQHEGRENWRLWGPYLAERAWGTVREDYSEYGGAWEHFDHDQARSRAYRWNEDGLGGISDEQAAAVLRAGAVERPRPDPQGARLRPHRQPGQPRRGRQGVLLLPRRHAQPQLDALPLQVSAGGVPVRLAGGGEPPPQPAGPRPSRCSTPACSRTTATSTSRCATPRPRRTRSTSA